MRGITVLVVMLMLIAGTGANAGEPGIPARPQVTQAFGSAPLSLPVEQPESVSIQSPGERVVYVEVPAEEKPGILSWLGDGVNALLGFTGEWVVEKPLNVTTEALTATRNVGTSILDGAGNMATRATE